MHACICAISLWLHVMVGVRAASVGDLRVMEEQLALSLGDIVV